MLFQNSVACAYGSSGGRSRVFTPCNGARDVLVAAVLRAGEERATAADGVREVRGAAVVDGLLHEAVAVVVVHGACGRLIGIWEKFGPPSRVSWVSR